MDTTRRDSIAKAFAGRISRRSALNGGGAGFAAVAVGAAGLRHASATTQDATPPAATSPSDEDPVFLFVQTATSGSFRAKEGGAGTFELSLEGHGGSTIYFSDRPDRIFGDGPTEQFIAELGFTPANPPNAALVADTGDGGDDIVVVELTNAAYDAGAGTLNYDATVLAEYAGEGLRHLAERQADGDVTDAFGRASLFIDDCPDTTSCYGDCTMGLSGITVCDVTHPLPGGPRGNCWSWSDFGCRPCRDYGDLNGLCNQTYSDCNGGCEAG